ncbi:PTS sugar transporter subunit IIB [Levilactobacillus paucivorans]|uniref:PTS sugar transporter subunit IIB n=1 Tax=Levilactobacillus paucivorans TaxID=616990 RepID=UPI00070B425D|nr:cellobiose PTS IIC subunit [Levilactobacillus paucivorans]
MKNILLVCGQGISSHLFIGEAKRVSETQRVPLHFQAVSYLELTPELLADQDLVLLTPQVAYQAEIQAKIGDRVPMAVIPNDIYGWLNSQALVKFTCKQLAVHPAVAY